VKVRAWENYLTKGGMRKRRKEKKKKDKTDVAG
jgi:hypothetical protein